MSDPTVSGSFRVTDDRLDRVFTALADEHSRQVIRYFHTTADDTATVEELIAYTIQEGAAGKNRDQLEVAFHHVRLPKLADLGVIEYDTRSQTVRYSGTPMVKQVLDVVEKTDDQQTNHDG